MDCHSQHQQRQRRLLGSNPSNIIYIYYYITLLLTWTDLMIYIIIIFHYLSLHVFCIFCRESNENFVLQSLHTTDFRRCQSLSSKSYNSPWFKGGSMAANGERYLTLLTNKYTRKHFTWYTHIHGVCSLIITSLVCSFIIHSISSSSFVLPFLFLVFWPLAWLLFDRLTV